MLDYKLVEAMALVVIEGGFEKAARVLHLTQSAVSQRVRLLEEQTGQVLLSRTTPPRATKAGRGVLRHYLQVRRLEEELTPDLFPRGEHGFSSLSLGVNADSLGSWLFEAVGDFLVKERLVLDLRLDDQEETHKLLRDGEVAGCVGAREEPIQGCSCTYLGRMDYRLFASPEFAETWFPDGLTLEAAGRAPVIVFNRKDALHDKLFAKVLGRSPEDFPAHYAPSFDLFPVLVSRGVGCGMLPEEQSRDLERRGVVVDVAHGAAVSVKLYWIRWNVASKVLEKFSRELVDKARELLAQ